MMQFKVLLKETLIHEVKVTARTQDEANILATSHLWDEPPMTRSVGKLLLVPKDSLLLAIT